LMAEKRMWLGALLSDSSIFGWQSAMSCW